MSKALNRVIGFEHPPDRATRAQHRSLATVELITTAALALSTVVAVTAVSIGIARADLPAIDGGVAEVVLRVTGFA